MSTFVSEFFAIVSITYTPRSGGGFTCHCLKKPTVVLQRFGTFSSPILVGVPPTTERLDKGHSSPEKLGHSHKIESNMSKPQMNGLQCNLTFCDRNTKKKM